MDSHIRQTKMFGKTAAICVVVDMLLCVLDLFNCPESNLSSLMTSTVKSQWSRNIRWATRAQNASIKWAGYLLKKIWTSFKNLINLLLTWICKKTVKMCRSFPTDVISGFANAAESVDIIINKKNKYNQLTNNQRCKYY